MSYIEIFKFNKKGESESCGTVQNAYSGCIAIWDILGNKYCGHGASIFDMSEMQKIWDLADDMRVSYDERIVLCTTFDRCLIRKEDIPRVVSAFREFEGETSLNKQADILEEINMDEDCIAVGWHQNSISCDMWFNYNCLKQEDHFFLFDELEEAPEEKECKNE